MDPKNLPPLAVDFPIELTSEELSSVADAVNTVLKSSYLLGVPDDLHSTFQSLFDIAEEIADMDCCGYIAWNGDANVFEPVVLRHVESATSAPSSLHAPAFFAKNLGKVIYMDTARDAAFLPYCEPWRADSVVAFPVRHGRDFVGAIVFGKRRPKSFSKVEIKLLWILAMQAENSIHQTEAVKALSFYSFYDPLTHLYNRRYFENQIDKEIQRSWRNGKPFALLMIDIDGFKAYNDKFLHTIGDIALQELAAILRDSVRDVDTVYRFGGDEFAATVVDSSAKGAHALSLRIVESFRRHRLPGVGNARTESLSATIGVAAFLEDALDRQSLIVKADRALSVGKKQGGGKVCLYSQIADLTDVSRSAGDLPVQKIYDAARSVVDMDQFLEILLFTAMQGLSAGRGSIVVPDPSGNFTLRATIGFGARDDRLSPGATVPPGTVTSWVVEHGEPIVVSGPADPGSPIPLKKNGYQTESFLSMPLVHEGRPLGVVHLTERSDNRPFSREDLTAFQPVADGIASILHKGIGFREGVRSFVLVILRSLSSALELRYPFLGGHSSRVRNLSVRVGEKLGLDQEAMSNLRTAAELHDIGMIALPGGLFAKKRMLSAPELEIARKHPYLASLMLQDVPGLDETRRIILEHHEFYNGSGYPNGLRADQISLGARILAITEYYDSIISERPHRGALRPQEALQMVRNGASTLFDPEIARLFVEDPAIVSGSDSSH